jgi:excisionase family DNA binding protein
LQYDKSNINDMQTDVIFSQVPIGELVNLIVGELEARISRPEYRPPLQDEIGIDEATELTGYTRATLYRMSMNGTVPVSKRGKRLQFSRKDLQEWMRINTVRKVGISQRVKNCLVDETSKK